MSAHQVYNSSAKCRQGHQNLQSADLVYRELKVITQYNIALQEEWVKQEAIDNKLLTSSIRQDFHRKL